MDDDRFYELKMSPMLTGAGVGMSHGAAYMDMDFWFPKDKYLAMFGQGEGIGQASRAMLDTAIIVEASHSQAQPRRQVEDAQ